jgi:hypothetical protein
MDISMQQMRERTGLKEPVDAADTLIRQETEMDQGMGGAEVPPQKAEGKPDDKTQRKPMARKAKVRPANKRNINFKTASKARVVRAAVKTARRKVS